MFSSWSQVLMETIQDNDVFQTCLVMVQIYALINEFENVQSHSLLIFSFSEQDWLAFRPSDHSFSK